MLPNQTGPAAKPPVDSQSHGAKCAGKYHQAQIMEPPGVLLGVVLGMAVVTLKGELEAGLDATCMLPLKAAGM